MAARKTCKSSQLGQVDDATKSSASKWNGTDILITLKTSRCTRKDDTIQPNDKLIND